MAQYFMGPRKFIPVAEIFHGQKVWKLRSIQNIQAEKLKSQVAHGELRGSGGKDLFRLWSRHGEKN